MRQVSAEAIKAIFPDCMSSSVELTVDRETVGIGFNLEWVEFTRSQLRQLAALLGTEDIRVYVGGTQCNGDDVNLAITCHQVSVEVATPRKDSASPLTPHTPVCTLVVWTAGATAASTRGG